MGSGKYISTHALREEGDRRATVSRRPGRSFLPTPSARRATGGFVIQRAGDLGIISTHALREEGDLYLFHRFPGHQLISTHALREEGDMQRFTTSAPCTDFYPRPPRGGRLGG